MGKVSYHTHSTVSDGQLTPEELIKLAIERGFEALAITDHYTRNKDATVGTWGIGFYSEEDYQEMIKLKEKYSDKITVLVGSEFDWFTTKREWIKNQVQRREYDIKIVSVHMVYSDGEYHNINGCESDFKETLAYFNGDMEKFARLYYETLREGIETGWFDVVGHLDIIKIFNENSKYFSENEVWYKEEVLKTLKAAKKFNMKLDVNLQGLTCGVGEQFPSKWIIGEAKKMGIGLLVGTDSHSAHTLDYDEDFVEEMIMLRKF